MPGVVPPAAADREIPTLEVSGVSRIHFIGGEKGGVGKSMLSRLMAQYCIDNSLPFVAFDTDRSHGTLARFYADYTQPAIAENYEALDRIVESALEQPGRRVLVDLAAQTHEPLVRWMDDSGVLDMAEVSDITVQYWHVMDAGRDSVELLRRLLDRFGQRLHYVIVRNHLRGDDFSILDRSGQLVRARGLGARVIDLKHLHDGIVQKIDARNASFWNAKNSNAIDGASLSLMERQRLRLWLNNAYGSIAAGGV
ncbi:MAG: mobilization protein [Rubrivivax sp.]|nr:mobilization protein [Rubrivivax sp.]